MFYVKKINLNNTKSNYYYCCDDTLEGITKKFNNLIKKGVTDITIVEVVDNKIF